MSVFLNTRGSTEQTIKITKVNQGNYFNLFFLDNGGKVSVTFKGLNDIQSVFDAFDMLFNMCLLKLDISCRPEMVDKISNNLQKENDKELILEANI